MRDPDSLLYLTIEGGWTNNAEHAWRISTLSEAETIAAYLGLEELEVCFCFGEDGATTTWDFAIPLNLKLELSSRRSPLTDLTRCGHD